jgi:hypothetical protein
LAQGLSRSQEASIFEWLASGAGVAGKGGAGGAIDRAGADAGGRADAGGAGAAEVAGNDALEAYMLASYIQVVDVSPGEMTC